MHTAHKVVLIHTLAAEQLAVTHKVDILHIITKGTQHRALAAPALIFMVIEDQMADLVLSLLLTTIKRDTHGI
jgi:hypothetical protein